MPRRFRCRAIKPTVAAGLNSFQTRGVPVTLRGKTGWRRSNWSRLVRRHLPIVALQTWLKLARIAHGPLFRGVTGQGKVVEAEHLNGQEVARLVKRAALAAGVRERYEQKQLRHAYRDDTQVSATA